MWARRRRDFALTERSAGDTSDVVVAEHTRERNEPETSRTPALPRTAAQHPLLDLQRGVGNQAVARAVLARNPKYKHEAGYKKCGVDEREYYCQLRDKGFPEENIKVAGPGGAGADLTATGEALWIVEVKGGRDIKWMSTANIEHDGNVPAKQLGQSLTSRLGSTITGSTPFSEEGEKVTVREYLSQPPQADARDKIVLVCTSLDVPDALLAVDLDKSDEDKPTVDSNPYPLTVTGVISWLVRELKAFERSVHKPEMGKLYNRAYRLKEQWDDVEYDDGRRWWVQNPELAAELEEVYTLARRELEHAHHGDVAFPTIGPEVEIKLLPVTDKLPSPAVSRV